MRLSSAWTDFSELTQNNINNPIRDNIHSVKFSCWGSFPVLWYTVQDCFFGVVVLEKYLFIRRS